VPAKILSDHSVGLPIGSGDAAILSASTGSFAVAIFAIAADKSAVPVQVHQGLSGCGEALMVSVSLYIS